MKPLPTGDDLKALTRELAKHDEKIFFAEVIDGTNAYGVWRLLGLTERNLKARRLEGRGPEHFEYPHGSGRVLYDYHVLAEWYAENQPQPPRDL